MSKLLISFLAWEVYDWLEHMAISSYMLVLKTIKIVHLCVVLRNGKLPYDNMDNLLSLSREGDMTSSLKGIVDNLSMTYDGNMLASVSDSAPAPSEDVLQGVVRAHQIAAVLGPGQGPVLPEGCSFPLCAVREIGERLSPAGVLDPRGPVLPVVGDAGDPPVQVGGHVAVPVIGILHCHGGPVAEVRRARHRRSRGGVRHGR